MPKTITFGGLSNTLCNFDTTFVMTNGTAVDTSIFTYVPEVIYIDAVIDTLYHVSAVP